MKIALLTIYLLLTLTACGGPERSAIESSLAWSRMNRLPDSAEQIEAVTSGSAFSRQFEVSFRASRETIEAWLQESPGTQTAAVSKVGSVTTYKVAPGAGAQFAQVTVDWSTLRVTIRTYWS